MNVALSLENIEPDLENKWWWTQSFNYDPTQIVHNNEVHVYADWDLELERNVIYIPFVFRSSLENYKQIVTLILDDEAN